jgi:hypothetical protein
MKLHCPSQVSLAQAEIICREARVRGTLLCVFFFCVCDGAALFWRYMDAHWVIWGGIAAITLLLAPDFLFRCIPALWRKSNWLLAIQPDGLWVNMRVCCNDHLPEGQTIVWFDLAEISAARAYVEGYTTPSMDAGPSTTRWKTTHLQLELMHTDTQSLQEAISAERQRKPPKRAVLGFIHISSKISHYPITLPQPNVLRIQWRGSKDHVVPSLKYVLHETSLRKKAMVGAAKQFDNWKTMDMVAFDELVRRLVTSGNIITASKLLTGRLGITITEAHRQVESIENALNVKGLEPHGTD